MWSWRKRKFADLFFKDGLKWCKSRRSYRDNNIKAAQSSNCQRFFRKIPFQLSQEKADYSVKFSIYNVCFASSAQMGPVVSNIWKSTSSPDTHSLRWGQISNDSTRIQDSILSLKLPEAVSVSFNVNVIVWFCRFVTVHEGNCEFPSERWDPVWWNHSQDS